MIFGEKLKKARKDKGLTQTQLGELVGINFNTISNYEKGKTYPQNRQIYTDLAKALDVDEDYLKSENEEFILAAAEKYGYTGKLEAQKFVQKGAALFAGGELSIEEIDNVMIELQRVYWTIKEKQKKESESKE